MFELILMCPQEQVEDISDALDALDALSVSVEDMDAHTDAEQALFGEPGMPAPKDGWNRSRITALFKSVRALKRRPSCWRCKTFSRAASCWGFRSWSHKTGCA